ncbi:MAG: trypsin-like peptidase domain-containing protein, partial [Micromonosporaceae bacterium]|nr:trypsin-like peptidase domain-containing protein [Micromonosporaceae bacterium]
MAIYAPGNDKPAGSGVLIDEQRVLTCDHVVAKFRNDLRGARVAFRKANLVPTLWLAIAGISDHDPESDVAVVVLSEAVTVTPAPLLCPEPEHLLDQLWWAFGFPTGFPKGNDAHGRVGAVLADGYVRLDTDSRYVVEPGFSGTGLWSPRYQRVVGLVGQAQGGGEHRGDAAAITLHRADRALPAVGLQVLAGWRVDDAGEVAHAAWGWNLQTDPETATHWDPRARGVTRRSERGHRFQGRRAALTRIAGWLARPPRDRRVLVVTGSPGVGKSAVLGRIVTTADAETRRRMPSDGHVCAPVGSVACAVHVKGKTALDVAEEIARAIALPLPERVEELPISVYQWLAARPDRVCNLVFDALDEAVTPGDTRAIITALVLPIARRCADVGAQTLVAARRRDAEGNLLDVFAGVADVIDLDTPEYSEPTDLAAYTLTTLQLHGDERPDNPYLDSRVAASVADKITDMASGNFLVAGLAARAHGLHDLVAVDPEQVTFPTDVEQALHTYLRRMIDAGPSWALEAFTALAHAQAPGLDLDLWRTVLAALDHQATTTDLLAFANGSAANFLIESASDGPEPAYRLFHQALNDTLLDTPHRPNQQRAIAETLLARGQHQGWANVNRYLLRSLPVHAAQANLVDALLADDEFLLHADLIRLIPHTDHATTAIGHARARMLRLTPQAADATPTERAERFSVTTALANLDAPIASTHPVRYHGRWAVVSARAEHMLLEGHSRWVRKVCVVTVGGRILLVSASADGTVRLWDPTTGQHERTLEGHTGAVNGVCAVSVGDRTLIASASA